MTPARECETNAKHSNTTEAALSLMFPLYTLRYRRTISKLEINPMLTRVINRAASRQGDSRRQRGRFPFTGRFREGSGRSKARGKGRGRRSRGLSGRKTRGASKPEPHFIRT